MFTKITLVTAAAALLLSASSATYAAPKNRQNSEPSYAPELLANPNAKTPKGQRTSEPLYFQHATGADCM